MRAPFQVLVIPFRRTAIGILYALLKRRDAGYWQSVAGGGEDAETPEEAARREVAEEIGVAGAPLIRLDAVASIPVIHFRDHHLWGPGRHVVPEYAFGCDCLDADLHLSDEHTEYRWLDYHDAYELVRFDSNRTALWELRRRLEPGSRE